MKKVLLVVLVILVLSVFALTACSGSGSTAEPNADTAVETVVEGEASDVVDGAGAVEVTATP